MFLPAAKRLILRIVLGDIDVAIVVLGIIQQLIVSIVPASDRCCHAPSENEQEMEETTKAA